MNVQLFSHYSCFIKMMDHFRKKTKEQTDQYDVVRQTDRYVDRQIQTIWAANLMSIFVTVAKVSQSWR